MKIMHIFKNDTGGGARNFERCVTALARIGLEQRAVLRPHPHHMAMLAGSGVAAVPARIGNMFDIYSPIILAREVRRFRPDIVLAWMGRAARFMPRGDHVAVARIQRYKYKDYRRCDHLVTHTHIHYDQVIEQGWPEDRMHCLPNFVGIEVASPLPRGTDEPVVLALGRLANGKGFDILLRAFARLDEGILWLAGDGPQRAELIALAQTLGIDRRVRFLGWRNDTAALFASVDLFVLPSMREAFGNVVIEAWAQGVPVIATATDGANMLLSETGAGYLVPIGDPVALSVAITEVLANKALCADFVKRGRDAHQTSYSESVGVAAYQNFFERIIKR